MRSISPTRVACHTVTHPTIARCPLPHVAAQVLEGRTGQAPSAASAERRPRRLWPVVLGICAAALLLLGVGIRLVFLAQRMPDAPAAGERQPVAAGQEPVVVEQDPVSTPPENKLELEPFTALDIDVGIGDIRMEEGDGWYLSLTSGGQDGDGTPYRLNHSQSGDTLEIWSTPENISGDGSPKGEVVLTVPEGTVLKSLKVSGRRAQIDLSAQYARLTGIDLSLADYCITLTLTQLPNVNAVSITADGRELPYRETQVLLSADTLLSSRESGLRPITVSLYFLDSKTGELRAEQQTLALYEGQTRVNALLEALAQGPEDDSLVSLLPEDFAVISSRIENGVCYLNLPASGSLPENEAERDLMLSALEQSILSLGGVDEVQFLIEGSAEPDGYR